MRRQALREWLKRRASIGSYALALPLAILACCCDVERDDLGFQRDPPGLWLAGDLHVHATGASNDTGGDSTLESIAAKAKQEGLDFVVLTDHSNSVGSDPNTLDEDPALFNKGPEFPFWQQAQQISDSAGLRVIDGSELSPVASGDPPTEPRGHVGCIPAQLQGFDVDSAFVDRPRGAVTGGDALRQARERGCFTVVNHPYGPAHWIRYDWTDLGYEAMEVFNGGLGYDAIDERAWSAWQCDLLAGRQVTPVAASDNHRVHTEAPGKLLDPALGWPRTHVFAVDRSWAAVIAALRRGDVSLGDGRSEVRLRGYDADKRRHEGARMTWLRMRGQLDERAPAAASLRLWHVVACVDPRPAYDGPQLERSLSFEREVSPGERFDLHVAVASASTGLWVAELRVAGEAHYVALSRAIVRLSKSP